MKEPGTESVRSHRRHAGSLRPVAQDHRQARRDVPGPHDRACGRRRATEDPERDRAQHPAFRADNRLSARGRDAPAVRHLLGGQLTIVVLVALLVCLIPTTIGGLLSAIGIAGMDRLMQHNVLAMSGRAVEAAGDVDTLLLDKTGTITIGNRLAAEIVPVEDGTTASSLRRRCCRASPTKPPRADPLSHGRGALRLHGRELSGRKPVPFSAQTRMSGVDIGGRASQGRGRRRVAWVVGRAARSPSARAHVERISGAAAPAGRRRERSRPGGNLSQGHGQAGHTERFDQSAAWASARS